MIVGSIAVAIGIGVFVYMNRAGKYDKELCSPAGPSSIVAIAIDATNQLTEAQRLGIKNRLVAAVADLPEDSRIEMWTVVPGRGVPERSGAVFCRPRAAKNVDAVTGNPRRAQAAESRFRHDFGVALDSALTQPGSRTSPIIETLQAIDVRSFSTPALKTVAAKKIILVSDLVQNTAAMSLVTALPAPALPKGMTVSLQDVDVEVHFIDRTPAAYGAGELVQWWQEVLRKCGAQLIRVERL